MAGRRRPLAPVPARASTAQQLDLALGDEPSHPRRDVSAMHQRRSGRLNAVQVPVGIARAWSTPNPLGVHPDANRFERVRRRHGDCPELLLELTADCYLRLRCVACRTEARFRVPEHTG
jgi:hypothetical protein